MNRTLSSHAFPSCSALACSSVEPPCCRSESLGCQRETGAEIRVHPPSPPVSITFSPVAVARDIPYERISAGIVAMAVLRGAESGEYCEAVEAGASSFCCLLPPVVSGLPL
ncbi:hypothetical protein VZT92_015575 [Zoarces viviparus]|uniref:Secreted protein n=1 Tax=Zoarces viviparus TaxID=48416 RepID=A0AAW1EWS5_ZOAVI